MKQLTDDQDTIHEVLQFQKQLRLYQARQLLLPGDVDAGSVGYRVGYEDPSHFSRDYKRLFGEPPARHVERIRSATVGAQDSAVSQRTGRRGVIV